MSDDLRKPTEEDVMSVIHRAKNGLSTDALFFVMNAESYMKVMRVQIDMVLEGKIDCTFTGDGDLIENFDTEFEFFNREERIIN